MSTFDTLAPHYLLIGALGVLILCTCSVWPRAHHENLAQYTGLIVIVVAGWLAWHVGKPDTFLHRLLAVIGIAFLGWLLNVLIKGPMEMRRNKRGPRE